ncbi:MAG: Zn-dependent hydrolase [Oscillospiraceae bacterium]
MLTANKERMQAHLEQIAAMTEILGEITRRTYSGAWTDAVEYLRSAFERAGMTVRMDTFGNLIGRFNPANSKEKPLAIGSHLDSVKNAGKYDGVAGIVAGLEMITMLHERGIAPCFPVELIATADEEGAICQKGYFGARFMTGSLSADECLTFRNADGLNLAQLQKGCPLFNGLVFGTDAGWARDYYRGFLEIHVEQGSVLWRAEKPAGIVVGVVGIGRIFVTLRGSADHAGPTEMHGRQDALAAAAALITAVWNLGQAHNGEAVCTVGRLHNSPNIHNVISGEAILVIDYRAQDDALARRLAESMRDEIDRIAQAYCVTAQITDEIYTPVKRFDADMTDAVRRLGMDAEELFSWAGHDAKAFAEVTPTAMIFMPSVGGKSHSPDEYTASESFALVCENAVRLLTEGEFGL